MSSQQQGVSSQVSGQSETTTIMEKDAWGNYLKTTAKLSGSNYEEVETWAWQKLQKELLTIHKRRPKAA